MAKIDDLRGLYHRQICEKVLYWKSPDVASMADISNRLSRDISLKLLHLLPYPVSDSGIKEQTAGKRFELVTEAFLEQAFESLQHIRPGKWTFSVHHSITRFDQYKHLAELKKLIKTNKALKTALGDYVIAPDVVIGRAPLSDDEINEKGQLVEPAAVPHFTPLRQSNNTELILHASISCKWTLRSDRSQNARTEGLNLIRNRIGPTPHIVVVTGEPMPSRIASLALGTGDIDCVYHFALHELTEAVKLTNDATAIDLLNTMIEGRRLRDIADLPFDLAI